MCLRHIDLRDASIVLHHVEGAVTEQGLQREDVAARSQIGDCEAIKREPIIQRLNTYCRR